MTLSNSILHTRLLNFRKVLSSHNLDAYVIPHNDAHSSEYTAPNDDRIAFISGFDGSAGTCVITRDKALLWTDGRYFTQANTQLNIEDWTLMKDRVIGTPLLSEWLMTNLPKCSVVGLDPFLTSHSVYNDLHQKVKGSLGLKFINDNLVDSVWENKPTMPSTPVFFLTDEYTGKSCLSKIEDLRASMKKESVDLMVIITLDEIAWLLNLRGSDISFNPVFFAYVLVSMEKVLLFSTQSRFKPDALESLQSISASIHDYHSLISYMNDNLDNVNKVWIDADSANMAVYNVLTHAHDHQLHSPHTHPNKQQYTHTHTPITILDKPLPITLMKSMKNKTEVDGASSCHIRDGVAMCKWLHWLDGEMCRGEEHDEITVANKLEEFRSQQQKFKGLSFNSISSFGPNSSVIHYHPQPETARQANSNELYLIDSGGQYLDGTTDITRTLHFTSPSPYQKQVFTLVLKGVLAIASAIFPPGTTGPGLDSLGRQFLWREGMDFRHGIGHGVGSYLCVHEGPQSIGPAMMSNPKASSALRTPLKAGMILSDEPGFYLEGQWGVRIENLMVVEECENPTFKIDDKIKMMRFRTLTMVPYQKKMIDISLLTPAEIIIIDEYHSEVLSKVGYFLNEDELSWLKLQTLPLRESSPISSPRRSPRSPKRVKNL